jgi:hypothetical protein
MELAAYVEVKGNLEYLVGISGLVAGVGVGERHPDCGCSEGSCLWFFVLRIGVVSALFGLM